MLKSFDDIAFQNVLEFEVTFFNDYCISKLLN